MSNEETKIKQLVELIKSASISLSSAKDILQELTWEDFSDIITSSHKLSASKLASKEGSDWWDDDDSRIVEWIFDWERMIDAEWFSHPIPANYISKSKLVEWDWLKLTIVDDWRFLYKQIKPVPRRHISWTLSREWDQFFVIANWKRYKVILAAITYFKASVWDRLSVIVPDSDECTWAAMDAIIPD